jgi:hypothetical protein
MMSYSFRAEVNFGAEYTGLATVGYQLYDSTGAAVGSRVTTGVAEVGTATGIYGKDLTFADDWRGSIQWDTGTDPVERGSESINPTTIVDNQLLIESTVVSYSPENPPAVTNLSIAGGPNQDNVFLRATVVVYDASNSNAPSFRQVSASSFDTDETSLAVSGDFDFVPVAGDVVRIFLAPKEVDLIPIFDAAKTAASATALAAVQTHGDSAWATGESAGTGARTVAVTVNDGTTALQSARVRFIKGAEDYTGITNVSGQKSFSLDDGTWSVAITLAGYTFTPTTLVVDDNKTQPYSMTKETITPSDPGFITGYWQCYDEEGIAEVGQTVQMRMKTCSGYGVMYDSKIRSEDSNASGIATFTNLDPGMTYQVRRGESGKWIDVTIPSTATSPYALQSIVGSDE